MVDRLAALPDASAFGLLRTFLNTTALAAGRLMVDRLAALPDASAFGLLRRR